MNIEKIEINGHYVWVDKDVTTMTNTPIGYCYNSLKSESDWEDLDIVLHQGSMPVYHYKGLQKIIAASPELNLEGVSTYVEWLTEQEYPTASFGLSIECKREREAFIKGYQTAEKELPNWDDVRKAIDLAREQYPVPYTNGDYEFEYSEEEIIEQLKQSKQ